MNKTTRASLLCLTASLVACGAAPDQQGATGTIADPAAPEPDPSATVSSALDEADNWAFAYVSGTTVDSKHSRSSSRGAIKATHPATGKYVVTFAGLGGRVGGNVIVTAVGNNNRRCNIDFWTTASAPVTVHVDCYSASGSAADSAFSVFYQLRTTQPSDFSGGYVWNDDSGSVDPRYAWNSTGQANTIAVDAFGTGTYTVTLPGVGHAQLDNGGNVQVTAYKNSGHCKVGDWSSDDTNTYVDVLCFNAKGAAARSHFAMTFSNLSPTGTPSSAYAWHSDNTQCGLGYTPQGFYRRLQQDGFPTQQVDGDIVAGNVGACNSPPVHGHEFVSFNPNGNFLAGTGSGGMVTAYGFDSGYCKILNFNTTIAEMFVNCYSGTGAAQDEMLSAAWVTDQH
jgi:hypothetical protein